MTEQGFRQRLRSRALLTGTFVKTPHPAVVEVLGETELDFVVLDAEHGPFGVQALDACLLGARAAQMAALVRVPSDSGAAMLAALDLGAAGLVVPHALGEDNVQANLAAMRYMGGRRGFSNSPRAGGYGSASMADHIRRSDEEVVRIFQIEDKAGVEAIDALAQMDDVDGYLIGRADLAVSLGLADVNHPQVAAAATRVCEVCAHHGKAVGIFLADSKDMAAWQALGASFFVLGSDQSMLRAQVRSQLQGIPQRKLG